jgi:hypothetical protein
MCANFQLWLTFVVEGHSSSFTSEGQLVPPPCTQHPLTPWAGEAAGLIPASPLIAEGIMGGQRQS